MHCNVCLVFMMYVEMNVHWENVDSVNIAVANEYTQESQRERH